MTTPFSRLLTPLDGSRLAEAVLPAVEAFAVRFNSRVTLIHVLEKRPPATVHGDRHLMNAPDAETYLAGIADRLRGSGIEVDTHVHDAPEGDLAGSVVEHAEEFAPDLVVLCAHGRGGLRGLIFGSIAHQVLQRGTRPILLIQPGRDGSAPAFDPRRILVPLDGKHEHEAAVSLAMILAHGFGAEIDLVFVVPTLSTLPGDRAATAVLLPATTRAILEMDQQDASGYLARVTAECLSDGVGVKQEVLRGDTVVEVLQHAKRVGADLIAMPSHGRVGLKALLARSTASRISAHVDTPLLLVRA